MVWKIALRYNYTTTNLRNTPLTEFPNTTNNICRKLYLKWFTLNCLENYMVFSTLLSSCKKKAEENSLYKIRFQTLQLQHFHVTFVITIASSLILEICVWGRINGRYWTSLDDIFHRNDRGRFMPLTNIFVGHVDANCLSLMTGNL